MTPVSVILTVLGYIAVLFVVAWLSGRRADNAGFFTGNRRTPWYMAAFAMIGAAMSGVTFISPTCRWSRALRWDSSSWPTC